MASAPTATPVGVNAVTETSANLIGSVTPNGSDTTYYFQWGSTESFGNVTPTVDVGSGTTPVTVTAEISGLAAGATYYYTLYASNANGNVTGYTLSFTAGPPPINNVAVSTVVPLVDTPHLAYPFTLTNSGAEVNEQDSAEDLTAQIRMAASCLVGSIPELPEFGIPDLTFAQVSSPTAFSSPLIAAIQSQVPQATISAIVSALDSSGSDWGITVNPLASPATAN